MRKDSIRDYFSFSRQQRRAIMILLALIVVLMVLPRFLHSMKPRSDTAFQAFRAAIAAFEKGQDSAANQYRNNDKRSLHADDTMGTLFAFDPNTLPTEGWEKLGLNEKTARIIRHYLSAGGHFYHKEDLRKIYGLRETAYQRLAPYITITDVSKKNRNESVLKDTGAHSRPVFHKAFRTATFSGALLDINTCDSAGWISLRGIGPVFASRILRFRKKLGGFYSIDQLAEVYGLPDSTFQQIKQRLKISAIPLKKININTATVEELKSHPYISYRLAAAIKAFREQHGLFKSPEDLRQVVLVDDQIYRKIAPYLEVSAGKDE